MARFQYLILMGLCVLVTLPLEFVFDARVWRRPRRLAIALVPAFLAFVAWDLWATSTGTWDFDPGYTVGVTLPGGMAVEELVFFAGHPRSARCSRSSRCATCWPGAAPRLARGGDGADRR